MPPDDTPAPRTGVAHVRRGFDRASGTYDEFAVLQARARAELLASLQGRANLRYLHRPANLEDVFLKLTGRELRD